MTPIDNIRGIEWVRQWSNPWVIYQLIEGWVMDSPDQDPKRIKWRFVDLGPGAIKWESGWSAGEEGVAQHLNFCFPAAALINQLVKTSFLLPSSLGIPVHYTGEFLAPWWSDQFVNYSKLLIAHHGSQTPSVGSWVKLTACGCDIWKTDPQRSWSLNN